MLETIVRKNLKHFTTSCSTLVLLDESINFKKINSENFGLSIAQINEKYNNYKDSFDIKKSFYASYIQRHLKENDLFEEFQGKYRINKRLTDGVSVSELERIRNIIVSEIIRNNHSLKIILEEFDTVLDSNDSDEFYRYIINFFDTKRFKNYGQVFEIVSFSILSIYFKIFGFSLNRFSTSFSNDGGMDFISANGIYQVTAAPDISKIKSDLSKLPGIKRVLVLSFAKDDIIKQYLTYSDVNEIITTNELKEHFLMWLYQRDKLIGNNLKSVILLIKNEFSREL